MCLTAIVETQQKNPGQLALSLTHTHARTLAHGSCFPRCTTSTSTADASPRQRPAAPHLPRPRAGRQKNLPATLPPFRAGELRVCRPEPAMSCHPLPPPPSFLSFFLSPFLSSSSPPRAPSSQGRGRLPVRRLRGREPAPSRRRRPPRCVRKWLSREGGGSARLYPARCPGRRRRQRVPGLVRRHADQLHGGTGGSAGRGAAAGGARWAAAGGGGGGRGGRR